MPTGYYSRALVDPSLPKEKRCSTCGESKSSSLFGKSWRTKDGLRSRCVSCRAEERKKEDTVIKRQYARNWHLLKFYKITLDQYNEILESQNGRCALCGGLPGKKPLRVDHDHRCCPGEFTCGKCIRGLLCASCNLGMERIDSDPRWGERAIEYSKIVRYDDREETSENT